MVIAFVIPTCVRNTVHANQLIRCLNSINKYHTNSPIYLINACLEPYDKLINKLNNIYKNIRIKESIKKGCGEQQTFKVILDSDDDNITHFIIMQDSMILNKKLTNIEEIKDVKFLMHFTNHRIHWDEIIEPITEYNKKHNITTHTSSIEHYVKRDYSEDKNFINYVIEALNKKNTWCGCFGNCCIITKNCVEYLNNKSKFTEKFINYVEKRERLVNESVIALLCHYYLPKNNYEESYDGLYYDGIGSLKPYNGMSTGFDNLTYDTKMEHISKIIFNRT